MLLSDKASTRFSPVRGNYVHDYWRLSGQPVGRYSLAAHVDAVMITRPLGAIGIGFHLRADRGACAEPESKALGQLPQNRSQQTGCAEARPVLS